ncbi:hypothetical protein E3N88_06016 [Mikania micrantha]|uniref:Aminotransferase class I/classII large domain-containing protein n=1 Tax=Mikania micrantha TaxID=192012 RepID=A0A5N6PPW7_9ASTR|nr:hypothetical protein E3N88_06016 [Mikania micrantha]
MGTDQKTNEIKSLNADTQSVRMFVADGSKSFAAQSYAKNMELYVGRVGALALPSSLKQWLIRLSTCGNNYWRANKEEENKHGWSELKRLPHLADALLAAVTGMPYAIN